MEQEATCSRREEEMQGIVMEGRGGVRVKALLWAGFGPLLGTLAVLVGFVLWPTENVFLHPDHWFECMLQCGVVAMGKWPHNLQTVTIEGFSGKVSSLFFFWPTPPPGWAHRGC